VRRCNICHTDVAIQSGRYPPRKPLPLVLGHEISGEVIEVGEATGIKRGDRVSISPIISCGHCFYCLSGNDNLCDHIKTLGIDMDGGFAEIISVPERNVFVLPDTIDLSEGSLIEPLSVCYRAVKVADVQIGDYVALFGCGTLGLIILQLLVNLRGANVIAIDIDEQKLAIAEKLGATETINPIKDDPVQSIIKALHGRGPDCAIEVVGSPITIEQSIRCVRKGGKIVIVGACTEPIKVEPRRFFREEVRITGVYGCPKYEYPRLLDIIERKKVNLKLLISHEFSLDEINYAFDVAKGKIVSEKPIRVSILI
jgi:2-desacetyl-2-hydroxyethyl bacteriochlorophyllide A dehydrogenase